MKRSLCLVFCLFGVNIFAQTLQPEFEPAEGCSLSMDPGTGDKMERKFYYSAEKKGCFPFYYKGIGGNDNRFDSDRACMKACSEDHALLYPEGAKVCELPMNEGSGDARLLMFHFSKEERTCRTFLYKGHSGNGNRFHTREECMQTCSGKAGRSGEMGGSDPNPDEYSGNIGLITGVVGGCIFAVAIIAAIAVFIMNKSSGRKEVPTQDIEMS